LKPRLLRAFTLVEILIVVVILGILAGIMVPQFASATQQSRVTASLDQLEKLRRAIGVYYVRNSVFPDVSDGNGTWGALISPSYMRTPPVNAWVSGPGAKRVLLRDTPDSAYQYTDGWIYDPATGNVWAGGFDIEDEPFTP
jgi:general secretion pathway protein G